MKIFIPLLLFFVVSIIFQGAFYLITTNDKSVATTIAYFQADHSKAILSANTQDNLE